MIGKQIHDFARELWPINRSLTGDGVLTTLAAIGARLPLMKINSISTGTEVFDWVVPKEWNVNKAFIITPSGKKICDYAVNNLHLVGYSVPTRKTMSLRELRLHLHSLPAMPTAIPYVTSYYSERWGFCISQNELESLEEGDYEVVIDSTLNDGCMNYGELIIPGKSSSEVFLSTYICHPSMANNELSGPTVTTFLADWLVRNSPRRYTYRIVFIPETIGSLAYLSLHHKQMKKKIIAGFNVTCVGDDRAYSYVPSRDGSTLSDKIAKHVLRWIDPNYKAYTWFDRGSDERQYCAPGIDLPVATISRTKYGCYPEYHTSLDNLIDVVTPSGLQGGYEALRKAIEAIENNKIYKPTVLGEPQLGKRGLYRTISSQAPSKNDRQLLDFLSLVDGTTPLLEISERLDTPIWDLFDLVELLVKHGLIE